MVENILGIFYKTNFSIFSQNRCAILLENFKIGLVKNPQNVLNHFFCQTTKFLSENNFGQLNIVATQQNLIEAWVVHLVFDTSYTRFSLPRRSLPCWASRRSAPLFGRWLPSQSDHFLHKPWSLAGSVDS